MSFDDPNNPFQVDQDVSTSKPADGAESGSGGDLLNVWTLGRQEKIDRLITGDVTNESSFSIPNGFTDSSTNPFQLDWMNQELLPGTTVTANPIDENGRPLSGTASMLAGGTVLNSKSTEEAFLFNSIPPAGVFKGASLSEYAYRFEWNPSIDAIGITETDVSGTENLGTIKYGSVQGTVKDYNGNPVPNTTVKATGAGTVTDRNGQYNFRAPGGTTVTMQTLKGTYEFSVTPSGGSVVTQDVQMSKVTVRVRDAAFEPISNAPVEINGKGYRTDESGRVEINEAVLAGYGIIVMDKFKTVVDVDSTGTEFVVTLGPGSSDFVSTDSDFSGFEMEVLDKYSNEPIEDLKVVDLVGESVSYTDGEGKCRVLSIREGGGEIAAVVGRGDNRYKELQLAAEATDEMISEEVKVQRKTPAGTR